MDLLCVHVCLWVCLSTSFCGLLFSTLSTLLPILYSMILIVVISFSLFFSLHFAMLSLLLTCVDIQQPIHFLDFHCLLCRLPFVDVVRSTLFFKAMRWFGLTRFSHFFFLSFHIAGKAQTDFHCITQTSKYGLGLQFFCCFFHFYTIFFFLLRFFISSFSVLSLYLSVSFLQYAFIALLLFLFLDIVCASNVMNWLSMFGGCRGSREKRNR